MKNAVFILFIMCLFAGVPSVNAQIEGLGQSVINVNLFPSNPGPNQEVSVVLSSYETDVNAATIAWTLNGKTTKSGKGEKTFTFTTGEANTTTNLSVTVRTADGQTITESFSLRPGGVDLVWQSEGYTPPFYKGKALFSHQNKITFIAIPHIVSGGSEISPKNLIYTWKKNGSVEQAASGFGKDTYTIIGSIISRPLNIEVEVRASGVSSVARASTVVSPIEPSLILYKKSPTYGVEFQKALSGTVELEESREIWVVGVPFFFGVTNSSSPELAYKWLINGSLIDNDTTQTTRIFRQNEGTSGTSRISLSIENFKKVLQTASNNFNLKFGENNN